MERSVDRMILGIDMDNVICRYTKALARVYAAEKGIDVHDVPEPDSWGFGNWDIGPEGFLHYHRILMESGHSSIRPLEDAADVIRALSEGGHRIRVITQRASATIFSCDMRHKVAQDTVEWLNANDIHYDDLCFVDSKTDVLADLYFDDGPHHIEDFKRQGFDYVIMDYEYNRHLDGSRVSTWKEFEEVVRGRD